MKKIAFNGKKVFFGVCMAVTGLLAFLTMLPLLISGFMLFALQLLLIAALADRAWLELLEILTITPCLIGCMTLPVALYMLFQLSCHLYDKPIRTDEGKQLLRDSALWLIIFAVSLSMFPIVITIFEYVEGNDPYWLVSLHDKLVVWMIAAPLAVLGIALLAVLRHIGGQVFLPISMRLMVGVMAVMLVAVTVLVFIAPHTDTLQNNLSPTQNSRSLPEVKESRFYSEAGFGDSTDYGVYIYPHLTDEQLTQKNLQPVQADDMETIAAYLDNFRQWIDVMPKDGDLATHYDFDAACLNVGDWFCLNDKSFTDSFYGPFDNYDLWLYDRETDALYHFHNNI